MLESKMTIDECIEWYKVAKSILLDAYKTSRLISRGWPLWITKASIPSSGDFDFCNEYNTTITKNCIKWFNGWAMIDKDNKRWECKCGFKTVSKTSPGNCPKCKACKWIVNDFIVFKDVETKNVFNIHPTKEELAEYKKSMGIK